MNYKQLNLGWLGSWDYMKDDTGWSISYTIRKTILAAGNMADYRNPKGKFQIWKSTIVG